MEKYFAPRWTWSSVLLAGAVTAAIYFLLPYLEMLTAPPEKGPALRSIDTAELPPPRTPPPPEQTRPQPRREKLQSPKPRLKTPRRQMAPQPIRMNLEMAISDIKADFGVNFDVAQSPSLGQQAGDMVFELGNVDAPPTPLARLEPLYPPRARMRKIEGYVILEFIVTPEGKVTDIEVIASQPDDIFTQSATQAVRGWRFDPGMKDGEPVPTRVRQKVTYKLQ